MELKQIQAIKARITPKIERGDYETLSKILSIKRGAAIARYRRNKENEVRLMRIIVIAREKLITKLQKQQNENTH